MTDLCESWSRKLFYGNALNYSWWARHLNWAHVYRKCGLPKLCSENTITNIPPWYCTPIQRRELWYFTTTKRGSHGRLESWCLRSGTKTDVVDGFSQLSQQTRLSQLSLSHSLLGLSGRVRLVLLLYDGRQVNTSSPRALRSRHKGKKVRKNRCRHIEYINITKRCSAFLKKNIKILILMLFDGFTDNTFMSS